MPTINVKDAAGATQALEVPNANGRVAAAASRPVVLSTEDKAALDAMSAKLPAALGRLAAAASLGAALSTEDKAALDAITTALGGQLSVRSPLVSVLGTVTRPADTAPYAVNDAIGTAVTSVLTLAGAFRTNGNSGYIVKAKVHTDQAANLAQFRVHLFNAAPTAIVDNAPFALMYADEAKYIGYIDVPAVAQEGAGSTAAVGVWAGQLAANADAAATSIFAVIQTKTAFTPASGQNFALRITVDQN